jgi:DNA-binding NtrC family response regulator
MEKEKFDVVITDLMMPEMNGLEILMAMQERQINIPSIMITGYPTIRTAIQAQRLGSVDYIPKPFTRAELLGPLNRALRRAHKRGESIESPDKTRETVPKVLPPKPGESFLGCL